MNMQIETTRMQLGIFENLLLDEGIYSPVFEPLCFRVEELKTKLKRLKGFNQFLNEFAKEVER